MRLSILCLALACPLAAVAETVIATRTIRANEVITADALRLDRGTMEGAHTSIESVVGMEAKVALYPGRPVLLGTIGAPALVERNQHVHMTFSKGGLRITSEGRALGRGGLGERIRVMNLGSRNILFATIKSDGTVSVAE